MIRLCVALCALALAAGVQAQQYKWKDKDGRTRYGDTPPPGVKATALKPPPPASSAGKPSSYTEREKAFQKRRAEEEKTASKAAEQRAEAQAKQVNCKQAKASLAQLESGQRVATVNEKGERVYIDDAQRAQQIEQARKSVSSWCG